MADQREEDLKMALRMSMQHVPPEPKRSKPRENAVSGGSGGPEGTREVKNKMSQRELMGAAAEKRMMAAKKAAAAAGLSTSKIEKTSEAVKNKKGSGSGDECKGKDVNSGKELSTAEANRLFSMVFGDGLSNDVLAQWSNQGIRFSIDPETSVGLVQHEGGPCGVLAPIQAFVLKYLLFFSDELGRVTPNLGAWGLSKSTYVASFTEERKSRALVRSMVEILFQCGSNKRAVIASLSIINHDTEGSEACTKDDIISKALEGLSIESAPDLQKILRVNVYTSQASAFKRLEAMIPVFRSRLGALLFLLSSLLSRGLDSVQADRDDPSQPLVTAPFGHASQEIVNLLLCGQAVSNVFDDNMDLGGGMFVKGISTTVEVGFLTLIESLNFCKVGEYLNRPKWPIWVVGSESHYTVLFALDIKVQEDNELERRETHIQRAFDGQDQSGGGGFISVEGFHQVLRETSINLPAEKLHNLCSTGFIVWSEFSQVLLDLDKSLGGLKDPTGLMGNKIFDLYHFNGIAKSVLNGSQSASGAETLVQRPRLTKLRVSVPPGWTQEKYRANVSVPSGPGGNDHSGKDNPVEASKTEPLQHAPLVDCIRTRWPRATCNWEGDAPSIV